MTPLGVVVLIQRLYGFEDRDVFRSEEGGWILSAPLGSAIWYVSPEGGVRRGQTGGWTDFEVMDTAPITLPSPPPIKAGVRPRHGA